MKVKHLFLMIAASTMLSACGMGGNGKLVPNEFQVVDSPSLIVPPDSELAPPVPGKHNPQSINPGRQAYEALFPGQKVVAPKKPEGGEALFLSKLGRPVGPDVRSNAAQPDQPVVKKVLLLNEILEASEFENGPDNVSVQRVSGRQ